MMQKYKRSELPRTLDLHGSTLHQGYNKTFMFVKMHCYNGAYEYVQVITGQSGKMNSEFKIWMNNDLFKKMVVSYNHSIHRGSWHLRLKKNAV